MDHQLKERFANMKEGNAVSLACVLLSVALDPQCPAVACPPDPLRAPSPGQAGHGRSGLGGVAASPAATAPRCPAPAGLSGTGLLGLLLPQVPESRWGGDSLQLCRKMSGRPRKTGPQLSGQHGPEHAWKEGSCPGYFRAISGGQHMSPKKPLGPSCGPECPRGHCRPLQSTVCFLLPAARVPRFPASVPVRCC